MKKGILFIIMIMMALCLSGCGNSYNGYWCNYDETATIVVLLEDDNSGDDRAKLEEKIESFENVVGSNYYTRADYAEELGEDVENLDIHDTYVIQFDSVDSIGTYIEELEVMDGILSAEQSNAKTNMAIYNLKSWGKYTYTNSDEATDDDLETGTYKIKNGVITFTPSDNDTSQKMLYTKDGLLCSDADCTKIFIQSNATCSSSEE